MIRQLSPLCAGADKWRLSNYGFHQLGRIVNYLLWQTHIPARHWWVLRLCSSKLVSDAHPVSVLELAFCNKFTISHTIKSAVNCAVVMTYIIETILAMIKMLTAHWPMTLDHCLRFRSTFDLGSGLSLCFDSNVDLCKFCELSPHREAGSVRMPTIKIVVYSWSQQCEEWDNLNWCWCISAQIDLRLWKQLSCRFPTVPFVLSSALVLLF